MVLTSIRDLVLLRGGTVRGLAEVPQPAIGVDVDEEAEQEES